MCTAARACRCFHRCAKNACWASNASRSAISASSVSPMMKGWRSYTARRRLADARRAASAKFVWRCVTAPTTRCCATLKTPPRCTRDRRLSRRMVAGSADARAGLRLWSRQMTGLLQGERAEWAKPRLSCARPAIRWPRPMKTAAAIARGLHRLSAALQKRRAALYSAGPLRAAGRYGRRAGAAVFPVARRGCDR